MSTIDDDIWAIGWLDANYSGGPNECSTCFRNGEIVKITDCPHPSHH